MSCDFMADHYDCIFPPKKQTIEFLERTLPKGDILDSACGTGNYAFALTRKGFNVTGTDISEEMITIAQKKAKMEDSDVVFRCEDMRNLREEAVYDGFFCIGNSLVHLSSKKEIPDYLKQVRKALKEGGRAVFQIVNYDRVCDRKFLTLPKMECPGLVFERHYDLKRDKVLFRQILKTPRGIRENTEELYPLKRDMMESFLHKAGFRNLSFHDGFSPNAFSAETSFALVVHAEKKDGSA